MKNYDDLQRFKEKTQTLDIDFKDMSGQAQSADHHQWAILRQLSTDDAPELGQGQRIDLPQPQPAGPEAFAAPAIPAAPRAPAEEGASLLSSLAATAPVREAAPGSSALFPPPPPPKRAPAAMPAAALVERQRAGSLFPPPLSEPVVTRPAAPQPPASAVPAAAAPVAPPASARFSTLFRSRPAEPAVLSKETLLKPLLEKIALCR
ncbi:cellulose biosynthesis protein BcsO [Pantoea sp. PSNIH1]|uniref:cellulose biosynthesis protein BcsO n=1 Tax=Pantoea sp. PSNIH1 TaxID=1484158 RepID=UPI0011A5E74A|nr:cellulose biosynthesis protein BcsO [Pantoea sp. PSNIH1]